MLVFSWWFMVQQVIPLEADHQVQINKGWAKKNYVIRFLTVCKKYL